MIFPIQYSQHRFSFLISYFLSLSSMINNELYKKGNLKKAFFLANASKYYSQEAHSSILELCASQKAAVQANQIHARLLKTISICSDEFPYTKLLFMYGKCGQLNAAECLFYELIQKTIYSWNALIGAYVSNGESENALQLYWRMRMSGVMPDGCTFASVLKACSLLEDLDIGVGVHSLSVKYGLLCIGFVANALVSMYAKCGQFDLARNLFVWTPEKDDIVLWNSIITGCVQAARYSDAISLSRELHNFGMKMNSYTAVSVLQACAVLSMVEFGQEIHGLLLKDNLSSELYEGNALIVLYTRSGCIADAVRLFNEMNERDGVSLNSLLNGYAQNYFYSEAAQLFCKSVELGYQPNQVCLSTMVSVFGRLGRLLNGKEIHGYAIKRGFDFNLHMGNTIMDMYTKCGLVNYSKLVFYKMLSKDVISWTTMIACCAQNSFDLEAIELFRDAQNEGIKSDSMIISSILLTCSSLLRLPLLKQIHAYAIRHELLDLVLENAIINAYGECGEISHALNIFIRIMNKDLVSWTSMITCYVHNMLFNSALALFIDMMNANVELDVVVLLSVLTAAAGLASLMKGKEVHGCFMRKYLRLDGSASCSLVDMYARCGRVDESFKVFNGVECKNLFLWTSIIDACGIHGRGRDAVVHFAKMEIMGVVPDHITFLALLNACSHSRLVIEGTTFFERMVNEHKLKPWPEHYACIVDLLGRAGKVIEAYEFIRWMPIKPTAPVWCALLSACQVYSNYALGKFAAENLLELEPENPGNLILISNTFAELENWDDSMELRLKMKRRELKKNPGCSWIEIGCKTHAFVTRDKHHKDSAKIYTELTKVSHRLNEKNGYVADNSFVLHDVE